MIYEIRTYTLKPGKIGPWLKRWGEAYDVRAQYSKLGGMWSTDVGPLNQVIHIWPYESLQQRAEVRAAMAKDTSGRWPPPGNADDILTQESDILDPVKNMQDWTGPRQLGEAYELRMYTYAPGDVGKVAAAFGDALPARDAIYPVAGIFTSQLGNLNRLYQLFGYKSWDHREEVRTEFRKQGVWPPHADARPVSQLVRMLIPAAHSPMH
jgi:NIPSNAP